MFLSIKELPYHLEQLLDNNRLTRCLLEWPVFERLFSEDFSVDLLRSWQKVIVDSLYNTIHVKGMKLRGFCIVVLLERSRVYMIYMPSVLNIAMQGKLVN